MDMEKIMAYVEKIAENLEGLVCAIGCDSMPSDIKSWMRMEKNIQHLKHLLRRKKQINGKKKLSTSSLSENLRFKSVQH